ncbi:MAG: EF-hand domain-containing protein [Chromatiaceae bacterium]|nr:EF-hand domain-containing protein [Chromatiaceae bacterium]MCP5315430.1 EF-hand domain-containing protein [Chromatiaceae bacterium]
MNKIMFAFVLASASAMAQQPQMPQMPQMPNLDELFMKQFDANQDGKVSKDEFLKPTVEQFDHMDSNHDGALDAAEVKAFNDEMQKRVQELQRQMQQHGIQGMPGMPKR